MKTINYFTLLALFISFTSCSSDDDSSNSLLEVEAETVSNLYAPQEGGQGSGEEESGAFIKFNFSTGTITTSDTEWDIAFRGTKILVNGGAEIGLTGEPSRTSDAAGYIATGTLSEISEVDDTLFAQDSQEGYAINGWYNYNPENHMISPIPGKIIVVKTHDNRYAKMEILSYYENSEPNNDLTNYQYYTFNYIYQPNEGETSFEQ